MCSDPARFCAADGEAAPIIHVLGFNEVSAPVVVVTPEQPYPSQEVLVVIRFHTSWVAWVEYSLVQNESVFGIYVTVERGILPRVTYYMLNVSLGCPATGSYKVNIRGLYYPRTLEFVVDDSHFINHVSEVYGYPFVITTESNSAVSAFAVNPDKKQISFNVSGDDGTEGYCNVTFPKLLLYGMLSLLVDDTPEDYFLIQNSTHFFLYFTYSHSIRTVNITGTVFAQPPLPKVFRVPDVNPTIQQAIDTANSGDTIRVRAGTYYENLFVDKSVSIVGEGQETTVIDGTSWDWRSVIVVVTPNATISGFTVQIGQWEGIVVVAPNCRITHNKIIGNNITRYGYGIILYDDHSMISDNNITRTLSGIIVESYYNTILHNDFIDNECHAEVWYPYASFWDDDYPSGGNYWGGYAGVDVHSGFFQNETGSDGIADSPYIIDGSNRDNYPLMAPINRFDVDTWNNTSCTFRLVSNSTITDFSLNETEKTVRFNATGSDYTLGFCRLSIPNAVVQDLWHGNYSVLVDNQPPLEARNWSDAANTYLYFTYPNSEHEIIVIPEFGGGAFRCFLTLVYTASAAIPLRAKRKKTRNPS